MKGGSSSEENSFGLVGIMSAGPILAVMLISVISGQKNIQGDVSEYIFAEGVIGPIIDVFPGIFLESLLALLPISILFFIFNFGKFKLAKDELEIIKGLIYSTGAYCFPYRSKFRIYGYGSVIGMELGKMSHWILIGIGLLAL